MVSCIQMWWNPPVDVAAEVDGADQDPGEGVVGEHDLGGLLGGILSRCPWPRRCRPARNWRLRTTNRLPTTKYLGAPPRQSSTRRQSPTPTTGSLVNPFARRIPSSHAQRFLRSSILFSVPSLSTLQQNGSVSSATSTTTRCSLDFLQSTRVREYLTIYVMSFFAHRIARRGGRGGEACRARSASVPRSRPRRRRAARRGPAR